ncbi:arabinogalactan protein 1 [Iris pallida]|uniref:Arabinogalactan protein 1 n=1 Tax=Iris pallida TaxID=29817 RepID=A0AAX6EE01_IRIPA|nr:arabinogalactan protein 1 [Iris pallida]
MMRLVPDFFPKIRFCGRNGFGVSEIVFVMFCGYFGFFRNVLFWIFGCCGVPTLFRDFRFYFRFPI